MCQFDHLGILNLSKETLILTDKITEDINNYNLTFVKPYFCPRSYPSNHGQQIIGPLNIIKGNLILPFTNGKSLYWKSGDIPHTEMDLKFF